MALLMTGCLDDTFSDYNDIIGKGDANIRATVEFKNLVPNDLNTRTPGDVVGDVSNLQMVIYKVEGGNTTFYKRIVCNSLPDYELTTQGNEAEPGDKETGSSQTGNGQFEPTYEKTDHADFSFEPLPYGRYKIYAVANVPSLTDEQCTTEETLKSIQFTWNTDVAKNNAMFGYFTLGDDQASSGFDAPIIIVNKKTVDIHAWIKRLVSKVTVSFDPSGLKEAVTVYVKSVTIHDIPLHCPLGKNNVPNNDTLLIANGESINYYAPGNEKDYKKWDIILKKGTGSKGSDHSNEAQALFFFENMQGDYEGKKAYLKEQIPDETGVSVESPVYNGDGSMKNDFKDRVKYGTYIEVVAYYESRNSEKMSSGNIRYRFMLGKNITYNYNAQRNYHYKLTLKLRGFANEADWHIKYEEPTPSIFTPDPYYISYLYGQNVEYPIRILTGDALNTSRYILRAEIIENPWWPYDENTGGYPNLYLGTGDDYEGFAWMKGALEANVPGSVMGTDPPVYTSGDARNFAGFLSLRQPEMANGKYKDIEFPNVKEEEKGFVGRSYGPAHNAALKQYYIDNNVARAAYTLSVGERYVGLYDTVSHSYSDGTVVDGKYIVTRDVDESVTIKVPLYTRPKKMVAASDFTGNNPYGSYMRRAIVRITLWNEKGEKVKFLDLNDNEKLVDHRDVQISQVRRVENPKAIYRAWDNTDPFEIKLMHLTDVNATTPPNKFSTFPSEGPWRASIYACTEDFVKLTGPNGKVVTQKGQYITGSTGTDIVFSYQPTGKCDNAQATRCAIILVEYHDYTCNHMIFVRQGYDGRVTLAGTDWSSYQVYATGTSTDSYEAQDLKSCNVVVTRSPLSMGSLLKRCQYNYSIREGGNEGWLRAVSDMSVAYINSNNKADTKSVKWSSIEGFAWRTNSGSTALWETGWAETWNPVDNTNIPANTQLTVPTYKQFENLRDKCDFGFGIAYADDAITTATSLTEAYNYSDPDNTGKRSTSGVRACIAYDNATGANVLFPLGKEGNGRRPLSAPYSYSAASTNLKVSFSTSAGALSYGGMASVLYVKGTAYRPITYNHYRTSGAVYWVRVPYYNSDETKAYASWDINYFTLTFNKYDTGSIQKYTGNSTISGGNASDALPIKLIYK